MREVNPDDYDWTTANELPSAPKPAGVVTVPTPVAPGITVSDEVRIRAQQPIGVLIVDVGWSASVLDTAEVQYRATGATQWIAMGLSDAGRFEAAGIERGQYDIRARATTIRSSSDWVYVNGWEAALAGLPPSDVTDLTLAIVGAVGHLSWTAPSEEAVSYFQVRWSPLTSGATYSNATTIVPRVARPATSVAIAARPGTYFVRVIDKLGNESLVPASVVTTIGAEDNRNLVEQIDEAPGFTGTKSNVVLDGSALRLSDYSAPGSGTYDFATSVDLGAVYTSRVTATVNVTRLDDGAGLFDDGRVTIDDVKQLTQAQATDIFMRHYFRDPGIDRLPECLQASVFDMYVNAGANAVSILQRLVAQMGYPCTADGVIGPNTLAAVEQATAAAPDYIADAYAIARRNYYFRLADARPASRKYARTRAGGKGGWITRAEDFMSPRYRMTQAQFQERVSAWG